MACAIAKSSCSFKEPEESEALSPEPPTPKVRTRGQAQDIQARLTVAAEQSALHHRKSAEALERSAVAQEKNTEAARRMAVAQEELAH